MLKFGHIFLNAGNSSKPVLTFGALKYRCTKTDEQAQTTTQIWTVKNLIFGLGHTLLSPGAEFLDAVRRCVSLLSSRVRLQQLTDMDFSPGSPPF